MHMKAWQVNLFKQLTVKSCLLYFSTASHHIWECNSLQKYFYLNNFNILIRSQLCQILPSTLLLSN